MKIIYLLFLWTFSALCVAVRSNLEKQEITESDIVFFLHTNEIEQEIRLTPDNLQQVSPAKPTKFIIHGWISSHTDDWIEQTTQNYKKRGDFNIILVDWFSAAAQPREETARVVPDIGYYVGKFVNELYTKRSLILKDIHIIGFSFGAHVAGFAGKMIQKMTGSKIARITGLDPESKYFLNVTNPEGKLYRSDATFVDVLHTDGGGKGIFEPMGKVDFYANGGMRPQPGCMPGMDESSRCSHLRATMLFAEAVENEKSFASLRCESFTMFKLGRCFGNRRISMGSDLSPSEEGTFHFETNAGYPYTMEDYLNAF